MGRWEWVESNRGRGLFDLAADLAEQQDVSAEQLDILAMVKARFAARKKAVRETEPRGPFRDYLYGNSGSWVGKHAGGPPSVPPGFVASGPTPRSDLLDFSLNLDFCMH